MHALFCAGTSCLNGGKAYHSGTIVNDNAGGSSAAECQQKCAADTACNFWDWDGSTYCRLRSNQGDGPVAASGYSAGPKICTIIGEPPSSAPFAALWRQKFKKNPKERSLVSVETQPSAHSLEHGTATEL